MERILILTTGGTIDKLYFDAQSRYEVGPPYIASILADLLPHLPFRVAPLFRKDSLELTEKDREEIRSAAAEAAERSIVITHGTDTMVQTALSLSGVVGKTIVLTGALQPALFRNSDALFNIGGAVIGAQTLPPGVYVVMNGRVFTADNVRKNLAENRFEPIKDS